MSISTFRIRRAATKLADKVAYQDFYITKHQGMMHYAVDTFDLQTGSRKAYSIANRMWDSVNMRFPEFGLDNDRNFKADAEDV